MWLQPAALPTVTGGAVLLLDTDRVDRQIIRSVLVDRGYPVLEARDAHEAQLLLEDSAIPMSLLLAAVWHGDESITTVGGRAHVFRPSIAVLYMPDVRSVGLVARVSRRPWAVKPVGMKTLLRLVQEALAEQPPGLCH
jgi:CheY-like chemotaxis protein